MLVSLVEETNTDALPTNKYLFNDHIITANEMLEEVKLIIEDSVDSRTTLTRIMRQANKIWRMTNRVKNGEVELIDHMEMIEEIEQYIMSGQKINAIKCYRNNMNHNDKDTVSLREAKDYVDSIHRDMIARGSTS